VIFVVASKKLVSKKSLLSSFVANNSSEISGYMISTTLIIGYNIAIMIMIMSTSDAISKHTYYLCYHGIDDSDLNVRLLNASNIPCKLVHPRQHHHRGYHHFSGDE
jgi:hypothetical protein